jgi:YcaO cyclodehydratase, ATP-ad Mg2+-binding
MSGGALSAMRLAIREDAYYVKSPTGVSILTHQGEVSLTGHAVCQWLDSLVPYLDGRHSLADLTAELSPSRRELVESLVTTLLAQGVIVAAEGDVPSRGVPSGRPEARFVGYFRGSAEEVYERYRDTVALIVGSGRLLWAVVRAAARSGLRTVRVVSTAVATAPDSLPDGWPGADVRLELLGRDATSGGELGVLVRSSGLVVHIGDQPVPARAELLETLCARARIPLAQAMAVAGEVWLRPATIDGPGWTAGWRRLTALRGVPEPVPGRDYVGPAGGVAANQIVHDLFRSVTGLRPEHVPASMIRIDLGSMRSQRHSFLADPPGPGAHAEGYDQFTARMGVLAAMEPLPVADFSRRAATLSDSHLGVFGEIGEHDFTQMPVHVSSATVADPAGLLGASAARPVVTGIGKDFATARYQTALRALATYGSLAVDPRHLFTADGAPVACAGRDTSTMLAEIGSGRVRAQVRGLRLVDSRALLVPAALVFPALTDPVLPYAAPVGAAAGYSWQEALEAGLLAHCLRLTADAAREAPGPFLAIDIQAAQADPVVAYCRAMLEATGEPLGVYDITGPLGVATCACALDGEIVAAASGVTMLGALRAALLQALASYQARVSGEPQYAPAVPPGLTVRPGISASIPVQPAPRRDAAHLAAALARHNKIAFAVPLDHDRSVHKVMPHLVCVAVIDAQE